MPITLDTTKPHGPVSGPINAGLAGFLLVFAGYVFRAPIYMPDVFAVIGAATSLLIGIGRKTPNSAINFVILCWGFVAGWSTLVVWLGIHGWSGVILVLMYIGFVTAAVAIAPRFATVTPVADTTPAPVAIGADVPTDLDRVPAAWSALLGRKTKEPISTTLVKEWRSPAIGLTGYTLLVEFERGSSLTWATLGDMQLMLAAASRLPVGGTVTALPGPDHQGQTLLEVSLRLDLDTVRPYPAVYRRRSIRDDLVIGETGDWTPYGVNAYQNSIVIGGRRGAGKTVLMHDMIAEAVQCDDSLVVIVDLNGGNLAAPWVAMYAEGLMDRSVIDGVAVTAKGAYDLAMYWLAAARARKSIYARTMRLANADILPVHAGLPAVTIFVDEGGEVWGDDAGKWARMAASALRELQRIGRAVCINVVFSVQRATADYLPSQMLKGAGVHIMGQAADSDEIAYMFGKWAKGVSADNLRQGLFFVQGDGPIQRIRTYHLLPRQIAEIAVAVAGWRPELDEPSRRAAGQNYEDRWSTPDVLAFLAMLRGEETELPAPDEVEDDPMGFGASDFLKDFADAEAESAATPVRVADADVLAGIAEATDRGQSGKTKPARLEFILRMVIEAGPGGVKTEVVQKEVVDGGFTARGNTPREDLIELRNAGRIAQKEGVMGFWFDPRYIA